MASSYQTLGNIYTSIRNTTNKDSNILTDAILLPWANKWYRTIVREFVGQREDYYAQISEANLVANQREYSVPADDTTSTYGGGTIKLLRVEVCHDGNTSTAGSWKIANPIELDDMKPPYLETDIDDVYSTSTPYYAEYDRNIFLLPRPASAVTNGLRIFWIQRPNELTGTSSIPDMPADWLNLLEYGILSEAYQMLGKITESNLAFQKYTQSVERMKQLEHRNQPMKVVPELDVTDYRT